MGRRQTASTKGGRFMNPADQERKAARKRELKKNKKQRVLVRQAVLKSKDTEDIIEQMEKLDQMEFDILNPCPLPERVVHEKRQKLRETYLRVMGMYKREEEHDKVTNMKTKLQEYERIRTEMEQNFLAEKFAKDANPSEIPLPDGFAIPGAANTPKVPTDAGPSFPSHMLLPDFPSQPAHGILKKKRGGKEDPPGPPCGLPPDFSDSENESDSDDEEDEDDDEGVERNTRVRFQVEGGEEEKDSRTKYKEMARKLAIGEIAEEEEEEADEEEAMFRGMPPMGMRHPMHVPVFPPRARFVRPPPPPPGMPPHRFLNRPPPLMPPSGMVPRGMRPPMGPQLHSGPAPTTAAVISAAPTVQVQASKKSGPVIEAKPQLRNMQQEVTRLVPTSVKVGQRRDTKARKPNPLQGTDFLGTGTAASAARGNQPPETKSKDDAYDQFMKEMSGLF